MKMFLVFCLLISFILPLTLGAQSSVSTKSYIRAPALGISFFLNDYITPSRIRANSLSTVLRHRQFASFKELSPGIGLSYFKGILDHIDFAGTFNASFVNIALPGQSNTTDDNFLIEADASANIKILKDKYWVNPYLIVGVGASEFKGYYGAFMPLGGGIKINFFDEAALFINTQYRIPVTPETSNYHFVHTLGIAGILGQKK